MSLESKFSGSCKVCGTSWEKGEPIHKKPEWAKWCSNPNCTQGGAVTKPATKPATSTGSSTKYAMLHSEIWNFALEEAARIYPGEQDKTARMILAQVFYKKNFDYVIHGGQS